MCGLTHRKTKLRGSTLTYIAFTSSTVPDGSGEVLDVVIETVVWET